jgi:Cdc6-like AAA superfamily ATPase
MHWQTYHRKLLTFSEDDDGLFEYQKKAYAEIIQALSEYESRINLYGNAGTGKTFLAHYLHHHAQGLYFNNAHFNNARNHNQIDVPPKSVIMADNVPNDRQSTRLIIDNFLWRGAEAVILITRKPIPDSIKQIHLSLESVDFDQIKQILYQRLDIQKGGENLDEINWHFAGIWKFLNIISMNF